MDQLTPEVLQEALRPLASLISKSEKAQQKLKPGSWQHTMLAQNLAALRFAVARLEGEPDAAAVTHEALQSALQAMASMIARSEKAQVKFAPGTSQHSLQQNRLKALRLAETAIRQALDASA